MEGVCRDSGSDGTHALAFAIDPEDNGHGIGTKDGSGGRFFILLRICFHQGQPRSGNARAAENMVRRRLAV